MKGWEIAGLGRILRALPSFLVEGILGLILALPEMVVVIFRFLWELIPAVPHLILWWVVPGIIPFFILVAAVGVDKFKRDIRRIFRIPALIGWIVLAFLAWGYWNAAASIMIACEYPRSNLTFGESLIYSFANIFLSFLVVCCLLALGAGTWEWWEERRKK